MTTIILIKMGQFGFTMQQCIKREAPWSSGYSSSAIAQKVAVSREFEARLRHAATGKLSLSTLQQEGIFCELGKDKAAKGEGWAAPFISCAQDTVGL